VVLLLAREIVGRKAEDREALVTEALVDGFECLVLRREAALGRDVHYEQHVALVVAEGDVGAVDRLEGDLLNLRVHISMIHHQPVSTR
jgi:hypothetical protein